MNGTFIWYELLTSDPDAAARFYASVLGWTVHDSGQAGMNYSFFRMHDVGVGGFMRLPADAAAAGMPPCWLGYVSVADVDRSVARFTAAGGAVYMPPMTVPGAGRMAMVADPQGAPLYVMTPAGQGEATSFAPGKPGHGGWHELHTTDAGRALAFYAGQFGWSKVGEMDMGPGGAYLQFKVGTGPMVGGMMNDRRGVRPHWLYVFNVDDIDAASARVAASGGETLVPPHRVPTGDYVTHIRDPQGARLALVGPKI